MNEEEKKKIEENLKKYRVWINKNAIARAIQGFLPSFVDGDASQLEIILDDNMQPCTDGKKIWVSLVLGILAGDYSHEDWMILLRAITAHEAQHVNSSNFTDIEQIMDWYGNYLNSYFELDKTIGKNIAKNALNIVEDGRIESIAVKRRPGMIMPFQYLNQILRGECEIKEQAAEAIDEYEDFWGQVLSYAKTGLYAPGISAYANTDLESNFLAVRAFIDDGVNSLSSADCRENVEGLLEELAAYLAALIKKSPELEERLKNESSANEYTSNNESEFNSGSGSQASVRNGNLQKSGGTAQKGSPLRSNSPVKDGDEKGDSQENISDSEQQESKESPMGFCNAKDEMPPLKPSELQEIRSLMNSVMDAANKKEAAEKEQSQDDGLELQAIENIRAEYSSETLPFKQTTIIIPGNEPLPSEMKMQAEILRREIKRILTEKRKSQKGLRRGTLDTNAIWKTGINDDAIFARKGDPNAGACAFYLLIDNSGSMSETVQEGSSRVLRKVDAARSAAAIIEHATIGLVPCKIGLFQQIDRSVVTNVIRTFEEKSTKNRSWNSLTALGPGGCNADSMNIRVATEELCRRQEKKKVLLILSDGEPSAYASRASAEAEVREAVKSARRKGVITIPIMFGSSNFLVNAQSKYQRMYEKNIIACAPQDISSKLSQLFRTVILK